MPNIDETYNFPFNDDDFLSGSKERQLQFFRDLVNNLRKMYEEIAIGVNNKFRVNVPDSASVTNGVLLTNLPPIGASLVIVSGTEDGQPSAIFSVLKTQYNVAATVTALDSIAGSSGSWNTVTLSMPTTTTTTGLANSSGSPLTGEFEVTILGREKAT